jgi:hypothetical protein
MAIVHRVTELFERQIRIWHQLADGVRGLALAETRAVTIDWFQVFIRHIPHRMTSTAAAVDPASIAQRACFLCASNMPEEEEGVSFGESFTIYCNPFPIVEHHLTIVHREHRPQRIGGQFASMLDLAAALPGYFIVYNGPECGASAPDHLHFQAGSRRLFPIEKDTAGLRGLAVPSYRRNVLLFRGRDRSALIERMEYTLDQLALVNDKGPEPLVNIAAYHQQQEWVFYLFPRSKHRPQAFHTGELMVSPASIDLCGIFVVPRWRDFEKLTGETIGKIFDEVTLPTGQFRELAARLERADWTSR